MSCRKSPGLSARRERRFRVKDIRRRGSAHFGMSIEEYNVGPAEFGFLAGHAALDDNG
jgi:hypothetical protein